MKDSKNRTPYDLAKEKNVSQIIEMLETSNDINNNYSAYEIFKLPIYQRYRRDEKTQTNVILFILLNIAVFFSVFFLILPSNIKN
jgi:hypothetical protein